jgi:uncharacterized membrane protein
MSLSRTLLIFSFVAIAFGALRAQSPMVVVQAATPAPATTVTATPPPPPDSNATLIQLLQQMKSTNEETLKKQRALLEQLDELQKAAEQMKAFSKRG